MRSATAARWLLGLAAAAVGCGGEPSAPRPPPSVLLVSIDTLRADHLSAYGHSPETSPNLDRLAAQGVLFTDLIAPRGQTWPSIASLFTAMHPRSHGVRGNGFQLDPEIPTLAGRLRDAGYATAGFITNMRFMRHTGFDPLRKIAEGDKDATALAEGVDWLRAHRDERFLLWLHFTGPHDPYTPPARLARRFATGYRGPLDGRSKTLQRIHRSRADLTPAELAHVISLYDAEIAQVDARVGELLAELDRLGLRESTLVVVVADHGDALFEHDHYFFHALSIHEAVLHVPLILRLPGVLPAATRVAGVARVLDVAPTILDLLGLPAPASFEGRSLLPRVRGEEDVEDVAAFSELGPRIHSVRTRRWHFLSNPDGYTSPATQAGDDGDGGEFHIDAEALYDIVADPKETRNLVAERPEVAAALRARLAGWLAEREDPFEPLAPIGDVLEELRAMGYVE